MMFDDTKTMRPHIRFCRPQVMAKNIVIIDGMSTAGKSFVAPLLSSLDRGELWTLNHLYEYLCTMYHHKRIAADAAMSLAQLYADLDLYNSRIGRYTNFRDSDISSARSNMLHDRYVLRTQLPDGNGIVQGIAKERPILFLMTHYIFGQSELLFDAFGRRLKLYLITVRHPLDLLDNWQNANWNARVGRDVREFQPCCTVGGKTTPWYAATWAAQYHHSNRLEKNIHTIAWFINEFDKRLKSLSGHDYKKVMFLPFEKVAVNPHTFTAAIAKKLGARPTALTERVMKKFGMPRVLDPDHIEKQYEKFRKLFRMRNVNPETADLFWKLCGVYENLHLNPGRCARAFTEK